MKFKVINLLLLIPFLLANTFCKKQNTVKEVSNSPAFLPEKVNGYFDLENVIEFSKDAFGVRSIIANAGFVTQSVLRDSIRSTHLVESAGIATINDVTLDASKYGNEAAYVLYQDESPTLLSKPLQWVISGSNNIPGFNIADDTKYPWYGDIKNLPDTIFFFRENSILINFGRADRAEITILSDNSFQPIQSTTKIINRPGLVKFEMIDLVSMLFTSTFTVRVEVKLFKEYYKRVGDRNFAFRTIMTFKSYSIPVNSTQ